MNRTNKQWILEFEKRKAYWNHDGKNVRAHALLSSNMHSGGYFNSELIVLDPSLLHEAVSDLLLLFTERGGDLHRVDGVVGPQKGASKIAKSMSESITANLNEHCFWVSPEKAFDGDFKSFTFNPREFSLLFGTSILLCDDVITSGQSIELTDLAITNAGGHSLPFIITLVNRSGQNEINGSKIISLIEHHMPIWTPEKCLLCKIGSKAIRPKENGNWELLNANL